MYQIKTLYTLNLHSVICQLHLDKAEKNSDIYLKEKPKYVLYTLCICFSYIF